MSLTFGSRRVTETDVVPALPSLGRAVGWLGVLCLAYVALLFAAAVPSGSTVAVAAIAVCATEMSLDVRQPIVPWALRRVEFGAPVRALLRGLAVVVFAARATSGAEFVAALVAVAVIVFAGAARVGLVQLLDYARTPDAVARGLPISCPKPPPPPPERLIRPGGRAAMVEAVASIGLALSVRAGAGFGVGAVAVAAASALIPPIVIGLHLYRLGGTTFRRNWTDALGRAIQEYRPEVVLYSGEGAGWRYQVEMWRDVLEALPHRVLVVLRDIDMFRELSPTTFPVVCVPRAVALMQLPLPAPRAILYVSNSANNTPFLRRRGSRSVFIGHGDSDKGASCNPFTRVYNEVWVAGQAGRDRYRRAGVEIDDEVFVQVGRPQLSELPRSPDSEPKFTVLYAPTWEGWDDEGTDTSLPRIGPELIRTLLTVPGIRVAYRPHPQTGYRDPTVRQAHQAVLNLLRTAGARGPSTVSAPSPTPSSVDLLNPMTSKALMDAREAHAVAVRQWNDRYWQAATGPLILTDPAPSLESCFRHADLLIADVSSVVTDWLATDRPYAITNITELSEAEFRARVGAATGGFVLAADLSDLAQLVEQTREGFDPTAAARGVAREYLLGPRERHPAELFRDNIARLCAIEPPALDRAGSKRTE